MSWIELANLLRPRRYEPRVVRDLRRFFDQARKGSWDDVEDDVIDSLASHINLMLLSGKLWGSRSRALRKLLLTWDTGDVEEAGRILSKYVFDLREVVVDQAGRPLEKLKPFRDRVDIIGQLTTWESYNAGKISRFRLEGPEAMLIWVTAQDERVCAECDSNERNSPYPINGPLPMWPAHPRCRCEWDLSA